MSRSAKPNLAHDKTGEREANGIHDAAVEHYEAVIIGAGFGGLRVLWELRSLGVSARIIERGSDVGGTWYWNRYPGARTDSESWGYIMNFSPELRADWSWKQRYPTQSEVFSYLTHVVERFDMRRDIEFNTTVRSAVYSDQDHLWTITCTGNLTFSCKYFIPATGPLSTGLRPPYKSLDHFEGEWYQASNWPKHSVDFTGKRVAVIGTGASGVQIVPMVAHNADLVTVFQRTPNYVLPARNAPITEEHEREIKRTYNEIWEMARNQVFGFPIPTTDRTLDDEPDPAEQQRILESGWETGGFRFINTTFADIVTNPKANHVASEFVRKKMTPWKHHDLFVRRRYRLKYVASVRGKDTHVLGTLDDECGQTKSRRV